MLRALVCLLIIGLSWPFGDAACPLDHCTCKRMPLNIDVLYYTAVTCDGYVDGLVDSLENNTRILQVSNLNDSELLASLFDSLVNFPDLQTLTIVNSVLNNVSINLNNLQPLRALNLLYNQLESTPEFSLNSTSLRSLDLSHNSITILEGEPFRTLRTLELLNLSSNSLTTIGPDSLTDLVNLKCLDLSSNNLTRLNDKVLRPVNNLQYLNLSRNILEVLDEVSFGALTKLRQLDVSWNRLARVAPGSLELPSLSRLLLAGNPALGGSREVLVGSGHRLQTLDASRTGLKQVPAALTHSIRTLRLAGNSITVVRCGDLDSYPLLQLLDFTANELTGIEDDALGRLETLSILYLTDNSIETIPRSLPEQLKVLHLEHNTVEKVSKDDLEGLPSLEVLILSDNKIRVVEQGAFSQLASLVALDLSRNPVVTLEPGCLTGPTALEVLRLSSIAIISPVKDTSFPLSTPERLISLDLSDSPGLARQFLSDSAALAASKALQELDVSRTSLKTIRSDLLHYLPQLRVLHIKHNEIDCEGLNWLATWMRSKDTPEYSEVVCSGPADLWGTPLVDLPVEEQPTTMQSIKRKAIDTTTAASNEVNDTTLDKIDIRKKTIHFILADSVVSKLNDTTGGKTTNSTNLIGVKKIILPVPVEEIVPKTKRKKVFVNKELVRNDKDFYVLGVQNNTEVNSTYSTSSLMYTTEEKQGLVHPGMLILGITVLGTVAVLAMLAAKFTRLRRRPERLPQHDDIEVSSLPGVTELW